MLKAVVATQKASASRVRKFTQKSMQILKKIQINNVVKFMCLEFGLAFTYQKIKRCLFRTKDALNPAKRPSL